MNRALIVGINTYPSAPLDGCVNDVNDLAQFLVQKCRFNMADIRLLTDNRATKAAIVERLGWLLNGVQKGDRLLFHYSGHGVQFPTRNPAGEVDGLDEAICPVDFDWTDDHTIRDKDFYQLFSSVPDGVEFVWISDSCHSGDLSRALPPQGVKYRRMLPPADIHWRLQTAKQQKIRGLTMPGAAANVHAALIAACRSDQEAADARFHGRPNGALTYFLLQELKQASGLTEPLMTVITNVTKALAQNGYVQVPDAEGDPSLTAKGFLAS
jgi:metacaspase-1